MTLLIKKQGFTLLELMIVIALASILVAIAVPSFQTSIKRNSVQALQRALQADLAMARSESIGRGTSIVVCGSTDGATCNSSSDWSAGWVVFVDDGAGTAGTAAPKDGVLAGQEEILRVYDYSGANSVVVTDAGGGSQAIIGFNSRGYPMLASGSSLVQADKKLTVSLCEPDDKAAFARAVIVDITGRIGESADSDGNGVFEDANGTDLDC